MSHYYFWHTFLLRAGRSAQKATILCNLRLTKNIIKLRLWSITAVCTITINPAFCLFIINWDCVYVYRMEEFPMEVWMTLLSVSPALWVSESCRVCPVSLQSLFTDLLQVSSLQGQMDAWGKCESVLIRSVLRSL